MLTDLTVLDSLGWEALKQALNKRVVVVHSRLMQSRRNRVWVVETDVRPVVIKRFLSGRCEQEFENLLQAKAAGIEVPMPLAKSGDYLVMEYVAGEGCEQLINHMFSAEAAEGMGAWLARYHSSLKDDGRPKSMNDAVLSNFIQSDDAIFGVDLEDSGPGDPLEDLGTLASSILGSEPFFTPIKFDLCLRMIAKYEHYTGGNVKEALRPYIAKHLRMEAKSKPLFRRTLVKAANSLERRWPDLA